MGTDGPFFGSDIKAPHVSECEVVTTLNPSQAAARRSSSNDDANRWPYTQDSPQLEMDFKWQPCMLHRLSSQSIYPDVLELTTDTFDTVTIQPFRSEVDHMISQYLLPSGPSELNVPHQERAAALHALQHTTHPSAIQPILDMVEKTLRGQAHPNFVRWCICNSNRPRMLFVRIGTFAQAIIGVIVSVLLALSHASRWWRILPFPLYFIGIGGCIATYKGLCVIIYHTTRKRAVRPWERSAEFRTNREGPSLEWVGELAKREATLVNHKDSASLNAYSIDKSGMQLVWEEEYDRQGLLRKIFANQVTVDNPAVRLLQDRIVWQSHAWALLVSALLILILVALPQFCMF